MSVTSIPVKPSKRRKRLTISGEITSYTEVDVEITQGDLTQALCQLEPEDLVEVLREVDRYADRPNVELLYYATRGDVWTRETHRQVQDLLAELAGRAS